ncbi:MAG: DEAD/DEAH box helicase [Burkholderiaceae bacterium]
MSSFTELGLAEPLLRAVSSLGYEKPTPIQAQVIPKMIAGHDVIGIAQTGTGKTASFVLPILNRLAAQKLDHVAAPKAGSRAFTTLILAPTRELAQQIADSIRDYGKFMKPRVGLVVGGANPTPQIRALAAGLDIVVATPGRLLDHMRSGRARLDQTSQIVLDEADQMLDMGFIPAIEEIMRKTSAKRQTLLLSATMPKPIRTLAQAFMVNPEQISVSSVSKPADNIRQEVILINQADKGERLIELLAQREVERAIVFTRTKRGTDKLEKALNFAGLQSVGLHGDKTQGQRNKALAQFKSGARKILVATDVAARGLDVDEVSHVVNFDMPTVAESYVHRIGRTGRAGRSGVAISFCDHSERGLVRDIERLINVSLLPGGSSRRDEQPRRPKPHAPSARPHGGFQEKSSTAPRSSAGPRSGTAPRSGAAPRSANPARGGGSAHGSGDARPTGQARPAGAGRPRNTAKPRPAARSL